MPVPPISSLSYGEIPESVQCLASTSSWNRRAAPLNPEPLRASVFPARTHLTFSISHHQTGHALARSPKKQLSYSLPPGISPPRPVRLASASDGPSRGACPWHAGAGDDRRGRPGIQAERSQAGRTTTSGSAPSHRSWRRDPRPVAFKSRRVTILSYPKRRRVRARNAATPRRSFVPCSPRQPERWPGSRRISYNYGMEHPPLSSKVGPTHFALATCCAMRKSRAV